MISSYKLSKLAKTELDEIWLYTYRNWSEEQAEFYYNILVDAIEELCIFPLLGESIERIKDHHRILYIKSHLIIYKIVDQTIYVDRILHKSMDVKTRLKN